MENYGWEEVTPSPIPTQYCIPKLVIGAGLDTISLIFPSSYDTNEERMKEMESLKSVLPPHVYIVENIQCTGNEHPQHHLSSVVVGKGEGLMVRRPQTVYTKRVSIQHHY